MTVRIRKQNSKTGLKKTVEEMTGVDLNVCFQCKKCSSGCPATKVTGSSPAEVMRRLHLGAGESLLDNDFIWMCLSCETCGARCPMGVDVSAVMDALRALSLERKNGKTKNSIPLFNSIFLKLVKNFGRSYDFPMLAEFKLRTGNVAADMEKLPAMLGKGKMAVLPPAGADKTRVKNIFKNMAKRRAV
jgi:heterodisulfide reductase subunit C2